MPVTARVASLLAAATTGESQAHPEWLEYVNEYDGGELTPATAELDAFRELVRNAVKPFDRSVADAWETDRHVPRAAVADLAAQGVFRERWSPGAYGGLGRMRVLIEELLRCNSGRRWRPWGTVRSSSGR